ncbi:MAG: alpha/beta hydrolase [Candidatus Dormibacteraeota bacterium]|nr:alpha/beta hydrolase [Candidatus Dormibacteraeota bacterium]
MVPQPRKARSDESGDYKTITVNGAGLAYVERGSGDAVILVHGSISDLRIWEKQMAPFSASHRAIAYSRRYAWPNRIIPDGVDDRLWPHVDDLAELIRKLDAAPAHLVGNSRGGFICLLTALRYPELVRSLAVEEPPVMPLLVTNQPKPREIVKLLLTRPRSGGALLRFFGTTMGPAIKAFKKGDLEGGVQIFARGVLGRDVYKSLPADVKEAMQANGKLLSAELLGEGFPAFSEGDARRITVPTLLLTGEKSPPLLRGLTDRLHELLPNAQRVDIAGASHLMHYEQPSLVNAAVLQFIDNTPGLAR